MPQLVVDEHGEIRHTDDMQDIITMPPSWLLRYGIISFCGIIALIIVLSAIIRYPEIVKAQVKVTAMDAPKTLVSKVSGKIVSLLVADHEYVKKGHAVAYLESTANHDNIIKLLNCLHGLQKERRNIKGIPIETLKEFDGLELGELQPAYQAFIQSLIIYNESTEKGILKKSRYFLQNDLTNLDEQKKQLDAQKKLQQKALNLAAEEFAMHKRLAADQAETQAELRDAERKYLSSQSPLIQTEAALITNGGNYNSKRKEISELDNKVMENKAKFLQALNSLTSQAEEWKSKYVIVASTSGHIQYVGSIQQNQSLQVAQEVFYINPGNNNYYGEMAIPQNNLGKVKEGQKVLIKLRSFPFEDYGMITGHIYSINDIPYKDSIYFSKVHFTLPKPSSGKKVIQLKQGMLGNAEIVTQDATVLSRIVKSFVKMSNMN